MKTIGMFKAKTHFAQLVDEVVTGKTSRILVTRRGTAVAEIIPPRSSHDGLKFGLEAGKWKLDDNAFDAADREVAALFT